MGNFETWIVALAGKGALNLWSMAWLTSSKFERSVKKIFNLTSKLKAGVIWANTYNKFDPTSPFGGYKESGYGREGGLHGLEAYLNLG